MNYINLVFNRFAGIWFLIVGAMLISTETVAGQTEYYIDLSAKPISKNEVEFDVNTNIPLPVEVMASIDLKNQKPDDVYIGYSEKTKIEKPKQIFVLNTSSKNLPNGNYSAEVSFYPLWGAKNGNPEAAKIKKTISMSVDISIQGSGQSAKDAQQQEEKQKWVMLNVGAGTAWNSSKFIAKLGNHQELKVANRNSEVIKVYYFPAADMTIFVNTLKNTVATWKIGKASRL